MADDPVPDSGSPNLRRTLVTLALLGLIAALTLSGLDWLTRDRIAEQHQRHALAALAQMLDPETYDNDLLDDWFEHRIEGLKQPGLAYRARRDGRPVALLVDATTERGYSGPIRLLVAVDSQGVLLGVRVLEHRETPGLGDRIERARSDWIEQFTGRALGHPPPSQWKPGRRGGSFDTLSNATTPSQAVIDAVRNVLVWFEDHRERAFAALPETDSHSDPSR